MNDPVNTKTPGSMDLSDVVTLVVGVVVVLGSLALDALEIWALPKELKLAMIGGAAIVVFGEKAWKMVKQ